LRSIWTTNPHQFEDHLLFSRAGLGSTITLVGRITYQQRNHLQHKANSWQRAGEPTVANLQSCAFPFLETTSASRIAYCARVLEVRWTDWTRYPEMKQIHRSCILVADLYQTGRNTPREVVCELCIVCSLAPVSLCRCGRASSMLKPLGTSEWYSVNSVRISWTSLSEQYPVRDDHKHRSWNSLRVTSTASAVQLRAQLETGPLEVRFEGRWWGAVHDIHS